jgi:hypothetical protein
MLRRFSRVLGFCYLLFAVLNVVRHGVLSLAWIAWALLSFGAISLVYTPVEKSGEIQQELVFEGRNRLSAVATMLGGALLIVAIFLRIR